MNLLLQDDLQIQGGLGRALAEHLTVELIYRGKFYNFLSISPEGAWREEKTADGISSVGCVNFSIDWQPMEKGILLRTRFRNTSDAAIEKAAKLKTMGGLWQSGVDRCMYNGAENDIPCQTAARMITTMSAPAETVQLIPGQQITGSDVIACVDREGRSFLLGYASYKRYFNELTMDADGQMEAFMLLEDRQIQPGEEIVSDWLYLGGCEDIPTGLLDFGKLIGRMMEVGALPDIPTGWCTWYYYLSYMNADDVLENMAALKARKKELPIRYIQVDDGWFGDWGDWEENDQFGLPMKQLADRIKAEGYLPGIWLCPFMAGKDSRLAKEHPDWMVQDGQGNPAGDRFYTIDTTHPEAYRHLVQLFSRLSKDWGYRYIKLDFVVGALIPGVRHDPRASSLMALREGYRAFREGVTEDTFILGCTSPMLPAAGLVDGMRISIDIFENWTAVKNVFRRVLKRYYYHKNAFINDADCLIVRKKENEDDRCWRRCTRSDEEIRTFVTAMAASGGIFMLSDKMPLLHDDQVQLLSKLFPINGEAAVPLDLMDNDCPGILDFGRKGDAHVLAFINWTDLDKEFCLPVAEEEKGGHLFEFWSQQYLGQCDGEICATVPAHGCRVFYLTGDALAVAVGWNGSVCPAFRQQYEGETLTVASEKEDCRFQVVSSSACTGSEDCSVQQLMAENGSYRYEVMPHTGAKSFTLRFR